MSETNRLREWWLARRRWLSILLAGLLLVLAVAGLLLPRLIDLNRYRGELAGQMEKQLGRSVALGGLSLRLIPSFQVWASQVAIAEDANFGAGSFVTARSVRLRIGIISLLRGSPRLEGIELSEPSVSLIRSAERQWNWGSLRPLSEPRRAESQPPFDLIVNGGSFTIVDRTVVPATESTWSRIDLRLLQFSPEKAFDLSAGMTMPGENGGRLEVSGRMGPIDADDAARTPVRGRLTLRGVELAALESLAGLRQPHAGRLTLDLELDGKLAESLRAGGTLRAEQLRLVADVEPAQIPLEVAFDLAAGPSRSVAGDLDLRVERGDLSIGTTKLALTGVIEHLRNRPRLDLRLSGERVSLESLLASANAFGFGPPPGTKASGEAALSLQATGDLPIPALSGNATIRNLRFEGSSLAAPLVVSELRLAATPGKIDVAPFRTALGARSALDIEGLSVTDYTTQPRLRLAAKSVGSRFEDLLAMAESFGFRPDLRGSGNATLSATVETLLDASLTGLTVKGQGRLTDATLRTSSLTKDLVVRNADLAFTGERARLSGLDLSVASSRIAGWLEIAGFARPAATPVVTFDLSADRLVTAELQSLLATAPAKPGSATSSSPAITADGRISVGQLQLDSLAGSDLRARLVMRQRSVSLDPMTLNLYQGAWRGSIRLDQPNSAPDIALRGSLSNLDLQRFLTAIGDGGWILGRLDGSIDLRGRGSDARSITRSLTGTAQVEVRDGRLTSFDLMQQVETLGRLANLPTGGAATAFRSLKTLLTFEKGTVRTDALQLTTDDLVATGEGRLALGESASTATLDYAILTRLSPTLTRRVLGDRQSEAQSARRSITGVVGQLLGNFLVEKDSIVIPLRISGPLSQPVFGLDAAILRQRAKESLLQKIPQSDPDNQTRPREQQRTPTPQDAIRGLLERFKKKEKP